MATLTTVYATPASLTITDQALAAGESGTTSIYDNTNGYPDILVGGVASISSGTIVAGDSVDVYVTAQYSATATDMGGGINALLLADDGTIVDEQDAMYSNMVLLNVIVLEAGAVAQDYHWGPVSVAAAFGGVLPEKVMFMYDNNSAGVTDVLTLEYIGVTPTSTA